MRALRRALTAGRFVPSGEALGSLRPGVTQDARPIGATIHDTPALRRRAQTRSPNITLARDGLAFRRRAARARAEPRHRIEGTRDTAVLVPSSAPYRALRHSGPSRRTAPNRR